MTYHLADNLYTPRLFEKDWKEPPELPISRFVPIDTSLTDRIAKDLITRFACTQLVEPDSTLINEN